MSLPRLADRLARELDPERPPVLSLRSATRRQMQLLAAISVTGDIGEAARRLGISYQTAKSHLASLYQKTGMNLAQAMFVYGREERHDDSALGYALRTLWR